MRKAVAILIGLFGAVVMGAPVYATEGNSTPKCAAYVYTGTQQNLCDRFGNEDKLNCTQVGYRVTLVGTVDPWGLDGSGDNIGTVGIGCEGKPLHPKPSPSASHSRSTSPSPSASKSHTPPTTPPTTRPVTKSPAGGTAAGPSLPLTGPGVGTIVGIGAVIVAGGAAALLATRMRRRRFEA